MPCDDFKFQRPHAQHELHSNKIFTGHACAGIQAERSHTHAGPPQSGGVSELQKEQNFEGGHLAAPRAATDYAAEVVAAKLIQRFFLTEGLRRRDRERG